ncbi:MAG TPA: carbon-nitrogen hydrolase family protein [Candidatus Acidoferrales bacterium]|nr:carbon-nitrogen hydrolase family protein [Candidatus Acidoferrales bacterium]
MLRVAALQLRAHDRAEYERVRSSIFERVERAARDRDLLVLPEGTFPAYVLGDADIDERLVAGSIEELARIARAASCAIVAGAAVRRGTTLYNSAIVIDRDGSSAGSAEKIFLWHFDRQWFSPGASLGPVQTSLGNLGVLVCADGRMPGIARALVDRGAELLVMPTAWVTSGRDPHARENLQADLLARVRALENDVPFVAANKCGIERGMVAYCGKSQIVDAAGELVAIASQEHEELVSAQIELRAPRPYRTLPSSPAPRAAAGERVVRIAVSIDALPSDIDDRLRIFEAQLALAAEGDDGFATLDRLLPAVRLDAAAAFDPGYLVAYRIAGYRVAVLDAAQPHPWLERIARTRAAELRLYVIVFDRSARRAYAIDPDGALIAGTFDDFTIASVALDPVRTAQTLVAPGTDVAAGVELVQVLTRREASVS